MTILILHGIEGHAGIHWQQWLHDELITAGHTVLMPSLPKAKHPDRAVWLNTVLNLTKKTDLQNLVIVGHSMGVVTALDFIEQVREPIRALISVAGFAEDYGSPLNRYFMKSKKIDLKKVHAHVAQKFILYGDDDPYVPQETLLALARKLQVEPMVMDMGGHLISESGYTSFPQILDIIKNL